MKEVKNKTISFKVTESEKRLIDSLAEKHDSRLSSFIREIVINYVKENSND